MTVGRATRTIRDWLTVERATRTISLMKKTNKKLSVKSESIRALSAEQLLKAAGGAPKSNLGSGCLSCGCVSYQTECSCFPCYTYYGATCQTSC